MGGVALDSSAETVLGEVDSEPALESWEVTTSGASWVVEAENWLAALGWALQQRGELASLKRLAIDVRSADRVVVLDVRSGAKVVLRRS